MNARSVDVTSAELADARRRIRVVIDRPPEAQFQQLFAALEWV